MVPFQKRPNSGPPTNLHTPHNTFPGMHEPLHMRGFASVTWEYRLKLRCAIVYDRSARVRALQQYFINTVQLNPAAG